MHSSRRWPLRRRFADWLRKGRAAGSTSSLKKLTPRRDGLGEVIAGTEGYAFQHDPGLCLRLTQEMVQQGWTDTQIVAALLDSKHVGGLWVRRQDDPAAAVAGMLAVVDRTRKPHLPMRERHRRIFAALGSGEAWSQKAILRAVGNARDGDVRDDLIALEEVGAIERVITRTGHLITLASGLFWDLSAEIRRELARKIARLAKGCLRLPVGKARRRFANVDRLVADAAVAQIVADIEAGDLAWPDDPAPSTDWRHRTVINKGRMLCQAHPDRLPWEAEGAWIAEAVAHNERQWRGWRDGRTPWDHRRGKPQGVRVVCAGSELSDPAWWLTHPEAVPPSAAEETAARWAETVAGWHAELAGIVA